jgi:hypothetical protein
MLGNIEIIVSWPAVAVFVTLIGLYISTIGMLYWKFFMHAKDQDVHVDKNIKVVHQDTCKATTDAMRLSLERMERLLDANNSLLIEYLTKSAQ